ncbi:Hypothetical protein D9617_33g038050 [Elsinoe fawcettii]|nr:Hypothetical protein D9617_33g038050 [Elsinoe fawcettii]
MSDAEVPETPDAGTITSPGAAVEVKFTEKEERVLKVVWQCMKTVPEVDMKKLADAAGFNTEKTCSNTWGVIKKKLAQIAEQNGVAVATPQKGKKGATPKKRGNGEDGEGGSPPKKRKTPAKKSKAKTEDEDAAEGAGEDDEDAASPVKKTRKSPTKRTTKAKKETVEEAGEDAAD